MGIFKKLSDSNEGNQILELAKQNAKKHYALINKARKEKGLREVKFQYTDCTKQRAKQYETLISHLIEVSPDKYKRRLECLGDFLNALLEHCREFAERNIYVPSKELIFSAPYSIIGKRTNLIKRDRTFTFTMAVVMGLVHRLSFEELKNDYNRDPWIGKDGIRTYVYRLDPVNLRVAEERWQQYVEANLPYRQWSNGQVLRIWGADMHEMVYQATEAIVTADGTKEMRIENMKLVDSGEYWQTNLGFNRAKNYRAVKRELGLLERKLRKQGSSEYDKKTKKFHSRDKFEPIKVKMRTGWGQYDYKLREYTVEDHLNMKLIYSLWRKGLTEEVFHEELKKLRWYTIIVNARKGWENLSLTQVEDIIAQSFEIEEWRRVSEKDAEYYLGIFQHLFFEYLADPNIPDIKVINKEAMYGGSTKVETITPNRERMVPLALTKKNFKHFLSRLNVRNITSKEWKTLMGFGKGLGFSYEDLDAWCALDAHEEKRYNRENNLKKWENFTAKIAPGAVMNLATKHGIKYFDAKAVEMTCETSQTMGTTLEEEAINNNIIDSTDNNIIDSIDTDTSIVTTEDNTTTVEQGDNLVLTPFAGIQGWTVSVNPQVTYEHGGLPNKPGIACTFPQRYTIARKGIWGIESQLPFQHALCAALFTGARRKNADYEGGSVIDLDIDDGSFEEIIARCKEERIACSWTESRSSGKEKDGVTCKRGHIFFFLAEEYGPEDHKLLKQLIAQYLGSHADPGANSATQSMRAAPEWCEAGTTMNGAPVRFFSLLKEGSVACEETRAA